MSNPIAVFRPQSELTVAELREARKQLELDLQGAIAPLLRAFAETTGVHVDAVDVKMQTLWRIGAPRQHVVIGVDASLDL